MIKEYILSSLQPMTLLAKEHEIYTWSYLLNYVKNIPYGRNKSRENFALVFSENRGTCSSKHALLKLIADENSIRDVQLVLGMYRMTQENTPGIGNVLSKHNLSYIPEAHCYLKIDGQRLDITMPNSDIKKIEKDILQEEIITPQQVITYKIEAHKKFLKQWLSYNNCIFTFPEVWKIREDCINHLSK